MPFFFFLQLELCGCHLASFSLLRKAMCGILTSIKSFGETLEV